MDISKVTKADLIERVAALEEELGRTRKAVPNPPTEVPEASAIAKCVRALDPLVSSYSTPYSQSGAKTVERVLRFLAEKYGAKP